jgi:nicotinamide mononucleotide transporter
MITSVLYAGFIALAMIGLRSWRQAGRHVHNAHAGFETT